MEGSASQMHCILKQRRMERCSGKTAKRERETERERAREEGKHWSMWWKKWTNNWAIKKVWVVGGTAEQALRGQRSHLQIANKQDPGVPSTFTGSLVLSGRKQKSPPHPPPKLQTEERKISPAWHSGALSVYRLFCLGPSACCFPGCWPKTVKSNSVCEWLAWVQLAALAQWASLSHSVNKVESVIYEYAGLRAGGGLCSLEC